MPTFDRARFRATHNSYSGGDRGSIPHQLDTGIRGLELDVHDGGFSELGDFRLGHLTPGSVVERTAAGWGQPRNLGPAVNGQSNEYMPSVDREGNLYFERNGLNVARWRNGGYLPTEKVGPGITNVTNLGHPFVAPDGSYLLYDARSPGATKGLLFISYRLKDGRWSEGTRVFPGHEARDYESCPTVSPDGRFLFFGRDHDIYWASAAFIEKRRPRD